MGPVEAAAELEVPLVVVLRGPKDAAHRLDLGLDGHGELLLLGLEGRAGDVELLRGDRVDARAVLRADVVADLLVPRRADPEAFPEDVAQIRVGDDAGVVDELDGLRVAGAGDLLVGRLGEVALATTVVAKRVENESTKRGEYRLWTENARPVLCN